VNFNYQNVLPQDLSFNQIAFNGNSQMLPGLPPLQGYATMNPPGVMHAHQQMPANGMAYSD